MKRHEKDYYRTVLLMLLNYLKTGGKYYAFIIKKSEKDESNPT